MRLRRAMWAAMLWVGATAIVAAEPLSPSGSVVDMAGVLDVDTMLQIDSTVANYASATGFTLAVITVDDLADDVLQDYARVSLQAYVASQSDPEARVALLMWSTAQQFAIAVSPAFGRELSAGEVAEVLREQVLPQVTADAVGPGLLHGVYGLMVAAGETADDEPAHPQELIMMARWGQDAAPAIPVPADAPPSGAELPALMQDLRGDPGATIGAFWDRASTQWTLLRVRLGELAADLRAGADGNATAFAVAGVILAAVLVGAWRASGGLAAPAVLAGLMAAAICWGLTGYVELTALLALSGFAAWFGLGLLRVMLVRNQEARLPSGPPIPDGRVPRPRAAKPATAPPPPAPRPAAVPTARAARREGPRSDFRASVERAHREGVHTPMLNHLIANRDRFAAAPHKKQRQFWMIAIAVSFFLLFPVALLLLLAWAATELNRLRPPQVPLADFVRRTLVELRAVALHRPPTA